MGNIFGVESGSAITTCVEITTGVIGQDTLKPLLQDARVLCLQDISFVRFLDRWETQQQDVSIRCMQYCSST